MEPLYALIIEYTNAESDYYCSVHVRNIEKHRILGDYAHKMFTFWNKIIRIDHPPKTYADAAAIAKMVLATRYAIIKSEESDDDISAFDWPARPPWDIALESFMNVFEPKAPSK